MLTVLKEAKEHPFLGEYWVLAWFHTSTAQHKKNECSLNTEETPFCFPVFGWNPIHNFLEVSWIEHNETYIWVNIHRWDYAVRPVTGTSYHWVHSERCPSCYIYWWSLECSQDIVGCRYCEVLLIQHIEYMDLRYILRLMKPLCLWTCPALLMFCCMLVSNFSSHW